MREWDVCTTINIMLQWTIDMMWRWKRSSIDICSCNWEKKESDFDVMHDLIEGFCHRHCRYWMLSSSEISIQFPHDVILISSWNHSSRHLMLLIVDVDHLANHYWRQRGLKSVIGWVGGQISWISDFNIHSTPTYNINAATKVERMNERTSRRCVNASLMTGFIYLFRFFSLTFSTIIHNLLNNQLFFVAT